MSLTPNYQLWLDNQSRMTGLSTAVNRVTSAVSALSNAFTGQTRSRARLNAIASYDQSNELFKVCSTFAAILHNIDSRRRHSLAKK